MAGAPTESGWEEKLASLLQSRIVDAIVARGCFCFYGWYQGDGSSGASEEVALDGGLVKEDTCWVWVRSPKVGDTSPF